MDIGVINPEPIASSARKKSPNADLMDGRLVLKGRKEVADILVLVSRDFLGLPDRFGGV